MIEVKDIKPFDLIKKNQINIKKDRNRLLSFEEKFVNVNCPVCKKTNRDKLYFTKNKINYRICNQCKTVYVNPRPTEKILNHCYSNSDVYDFWNKYIFPATKDKRLPIYRERLKIIKNFLSKEYKNSLIDIGSGSGDFCKIVKKDKAFYNVVALEPSEEGANSSKNLGIETIKCSFDKAISSKLLNKYDVVTSFEVIEHLFDPLNFIKNTNKILKKNGILLITTPNLFGFDNLVLGKKSSTFDHEHLNYFNCDSIKLLFEKCDFKIINISTPGKLDVDLVLNRGVKNKSIVLKEYSFLDILFKVGLQSKYVFENFQKFLSENLLSGHLMVIAQKK